MVTNKYDVALKRLEERISSLQKVYKNMPTKKLVKEVQEITEEYFRLTKDNPPNKYLTILGNMLIQNSLVHEKQQKEAI